MKCVFEIELAPLLHLNNVICLYFSAPLEIALGFTLPRMWFFLILNVITQYPLIISKTFCSIDGVMVRMLASCAIHRGLEHHTSKTKDYETVIYCFSAKHSALRSKSKDWLAPNQDNVS